MKKAVFLMLTVIMVITLSQFMVVAEQTYTYESDIKSLISDKNCAICHSFLGSYEGIMGDYYFWGGRRVYTVAPSEPDSSMFIWRIEGFDKSNGNEMPMRMPQDGPYYTDEEIDIFRAWITQGALLDNTTVGVEDTKSWMEIKSKFK